MILPRSLALRLGVTAAIAAIIAIFFFLNFGRIEVRSEEKFSLFVDGRARGGGEIFEWSEKLAPGPHEILAVRAGFFPVKKTAVVPRLGTATVEPAWQFVPVLTEIAGAKKPFEIPTPVRAKNYADDQTTIFWEKIAAGAPPARVENLPKNLVAGRFSPDGKWALFADSAGKAWLRALPDGENLALEPRPHDVIFAGGQLFEIAKSGPGMKVFRRDLPADPAGPVPDRAAMPADLPGWEAASLLGFRDERILLRRDAPGDPALFWLESGEILHPIALPGPAGEAEFLPDGDALAEAGGAKFFVNPSEAIRPAGADFEWKRAGALPDGRVVFSPGDGQISTLDPATGTVMSLGDFSATTASPSRFGGSADGREIFFTSEGRAWRLRIAE